MIFSSIWQKYCNNWEFSAVNSVMDRKYDNHTNKNFSNNTITDLKCNDPYGNGSKYA